MVVDPVMSEGVELATDWREAGFMVVVNTISIVSMPSVAETEAGDALTAIALFCLLGLVVSLCMAAFGLDVSAGSL